MDIRSPTYSLQEFSESVTSQNGMEILDAILGELPAIKMKCWSLGFGNMPQKGTPARRFFADLSALVAAFATTTPPQFREGFVQEAWPMLRTLSQWLVCMQGLNE